MDKGNIARAFAVLSLLAMSLPTNAYVPENKLSASDLAYYEDKAKYNTKIAFELALAYLNGSQGVTKDVSKAVKKLQKLANGYSKDNITHKSAYLLATLYMGQQEHSVDQEQAMVYFKIASEGATKDFLSDAPYHFAMLTKDNLLHIEYLEKSAQFGHLPSMVQLVITYSEKKRVQGNDNAMVKWLKMAADEDHVPAQAMLGNLYFDGDIVYQDYERAYFYLLRAAEQRNSEAQAKLGLLYKLGLGTKPDLVKARKWFTLAHEAGNELAGENLAGLMLSSENREEVNRALTILESAAKSGSKSAAQKMLTIYQEAKLVEKNDEKLAYWQQQYNLSKDEQSEIIGLNKSKLGSEKVYKASSKAIDFHAKAWQFLKDKDYEQAIPLLEKAAFLDLPVAQFDLGIALVQQGQKLKDDSLFLTAFAWVKVANNNNQERASELLNELQEHFNVEMLQSGLSQYREIKERIAAEKEKK